MSLKEREKIETLIAKCNNLANSTRNDALKTLCNAAAENLRAYLPDKGAREERREAAATPGPAQGL